MDVFRKKCSVSKFISVIEMQELVMVKNVSYPDVKNTMQEKKPEMLKEFPRKVLGVFLFLIISEINQISVKKNFRK